MYQKSDFPLSKWNAFPEQSINSRSFHVSLAFRSSSGLLFVRLNCLILPRVNFQLHERQWAWRHGGLTQVPPCQALLQALYKRQSFFHSSKITYIISQSPKVFCFFNSRPFVVVIQSLSHAMRHHLTPGRMATIQKSATSAAA